MPRTKWCVYVCMWVYIERERRILEIRSQLNQDILPCHACAKIWVDYTKAEKQFHFLHSAKRDAMQTISWINIRTTSDGWPAEQPIIISSGSVTNSAGVWPLCTGSQFSYVCMNCKRKACNNFFFSTYRNQKKHLNTINYQINHQICKLVLITKFY